MFWEFWSSLTHTQQMIVFMTVPFILFVVDILIKEGFNISIESAGCDLCLAAIGLDVSQTFIAFSESHSDSQLSSLFLVLIVVHLLSWIIALRLISFSKNHLPFQNLRICASYFVGLFSFYTSFGTILQFILRQGGANG